MADQVLIDSYCKNSYLPDQVEDLPPINGNLQLVLIDSYSENSYVADQVLIDSYCENTYLEDQLADLPPEMAICNWYL